MIVLGIETSCDETAAAVVADDRRVLADEILSQQAEHRPFGGIVPEVAARSHLDHLDSLIARALERAGTCLGAIAAVAATGGPGLIGGVMVGVTTAKAISSVRRIPFVAVNHLEGHALSARLVADVEFPYLLLLVSGGHCQLLIVEGVGRYARLGTTLDDAAGEAFDKAAKLLGLGYPGGPAIERAARSGNPGRFDLPRPMLGKPGCDFSFSGLKTALARLGRNLGPLDAATKVARLDAATVADLAAAFQDRVAASLAARTENAIAAFRARHPSGDTLVIAGGVAANAEIRARIGRLADAHGMRLVAPPPRFCTDNAAMIAWAGIERFKLGLTDSMDFAPRPRWPLDAFAPKARGAGVKA
jgi:N6-L-threonylcarbamoyladenine synthase